MASSQNIESITQCKTCHYKEGDSSFRITRSPSEISDKQTNKCPNCEVLKSGPLFISSKGLGWTSWKKRWFVLTRTSLVFFRTDPGGLTQKGSETNPTLGGIDLNNSGSVDVKADKKILTVLFPDGHDGRTFTLKAETSEELCEWKIALENALAQAPSAAVGNNGIFRNDISEPTELDLARDTQAANSSVIGRPVLFSLQDVDGSPSFLEKALKFIEQHGLKVEGVLRQSADVEEVKRRFREYEQGKTEFSPDEDAHVIGDCIKYVLREMPSSPVPASCCTALVEAYRTDRGRVVDSLRTAIYDTFPEPNRHLMQRILKMMLIVSTNKAQNRMSLSALAACMAPLLLRPLLHGECEFEDDFSMAGDSSAQLLKAAAAANHAQAIVIILLEEYDTIFDEDLLDDDSMSGSEVYSDSGDGDTEDEYSTENAEDDDGHDENNDDDSSNGGQSTDNEVSEDNESNDDQSDLEEGTDDDDPERSSSESISDSNNDTGNQPQDKKKEAEKREGAILQDSHARAAFKMPIDTSEASSQKDYHHKSLPSDTPTNEDSNTKDNNLQKHGALPHNLSSVMNLPADLRTSTSQMLKTASHILPRGTRKSANKANEQGLTAFRNTIWGRPSPKKDLPKESADISSKDKVAAQKFENGKNDLQNEIAKEVKGNATLQENVDKQKEELHEHRVALQKDVARLREILQKERHLRESLESGLMNLRPGSVSCASIIDKKTRAALEEVAEAEADIVNLKQKISDLRGQLTGQKHSSGSSCESCRKCVNSRNHTAEKDQLEGVKGISRANEHQKSSKGADCVSGLASETTSVKEHELPSSKIANPDSKFSKSEDTTTRAQALPSSWSTTSLSEQNITNNSAESIFHDAECIGSSSKYYSFRDEYICPEDSSHKADSRHRELTSHKPKRGFAGRSGRRSSQENIEMSLPDESGKLLSQNSSSRKFSMWGGDNAKKEAQEARNKQSSSTFNSLFRSSSSHTISEDPKKPAAAASSSAGVKPEWISFRRGRH